MNLEHEPATAGGGVLVDLPLGCAAPTFNLEKAVCSHGLFMMAPNHWDSHSKTLQRPLRLGDDDDETSYLVEISHPSHSPDALCLRVFGTDSLSPQQQHSLVIQVRRMLRLSEEENKRVKEFHEAHKEAKERGFGRVFRSPTLFEDMIKCILLCNCQWSRTLSIAQALCELQLEMQHPSTITSTKKAEHDIPSCQKTEFADFIPKTPAGKESKRKSGVCRKCVKNLANKYEEIKTVEEIETNVSSSTMSDVSHETVKVRLTSSSDAKENFLELSDSYQSLADIYRDDPHISPDPLNFGGKKGHPLSVIGNFPSPREIARLDEKFLAKRCNLGYRAGRILNLAREVAEGRLQLTELEYGCNTMSSSNYNELAGKLKAINGFGPFTSANVLMCMGFYHVIPTDSETIRHLKQVHGKSSTVRTVEKDVEIMYGKYAPFQFLAYWSEVWHFYEDWFGNASKMHPSSYKLITAANMKPKKTNIRNKRQKLSLSAVDNGRIVVLK